MRRVLLFGAWCALAIAAPAAAQDDCPAGHIRNPQVSPLDHDYMLSAFKASFRGLFGRDPTMQPGSGKDDGEYYIGAANHYGVYGDDQCHAGWSGYWESWLQNGHGDLTAVQTPARFLPVVMPPPVVVPPPVYVPPPLPAPSPAPAPTPAPIATAPPDLMPMLLMQMSAINQQIVALNAKLDATAGEVHTLKTEVETNWSRYAVPIIKYAAVFGAGILAKMKLAPSTTKP